LIGTNQKDAPRLNVAQLVWHNWGRTGRRWALVGRPGAPAAGAADCDGRVLVGGGAGGAAAQDEESIKKYGAIGLSGHRKRLRCQWSEAGVLLPETILPVLVEDLGAGLHQ
jgi:hypothetical protein